LAPHEHWHVDVSYVNVCGTFYYLTSVLDGCSRFIVHWELRESMKTADVEIVLQRAREKFPGETPRIISDNGPQFIAKDFKEFIRLAGMTHVRTSPYYPQSNGKIERWHGTLKRDCIRPNVPLSIEEARRLVAEFVEDYNHARLHSALGYVTPADRLAGRHEAIFAERDRKLVEARQRRADRRREATPPTAGETGTQRKASGVQGAAMSPLACVNANNSPAAIAAPQLVGP
jgi:transposase InsO family protein